MENWKEVVNSIVEREKKFWEEELNDQKKQEIIVKAIKEARKKGLIK